MIIDGRKIAENIISQLKTLNKPQKSLAAILVGDNAQSESFLKQKAKTADQLGIDFKLIRLSGEMSELEIINEIKKLNTDSSVGGIILQLPLPKKFSTEGGSASGGKKENIIPAISPLKDIDALTDGGKKLVSPLVVGVVNDVLDHLKIDMKDKTVAVVGRGFLIGAPILEFFQDKCSKIIALNSKSDINLIKEADIVISGAGKPGLITPELLKDNAVVIDFGYGLDTNGKLKGDFDASSFENCKLKIVNLIYTPTPGGTGPILVAEIYKNFYKLNR